MAPAPLNTFSKLHATLYPCVSVFGCWVGRRRNGNQFNPCSAAARACNWSLSISQNCTLHCSETSRHGQSGEGGFRVTQLFCLAMQSTVSGRSADNTKKLNNHNCYRFSLPSKLSLFFFCFAISQPSLSTAVHFSIEFFDSPEPVGEKHIKRPKGNKRREKKNIQTYTAKARKSTNKTKHQQQRAKGKKKFQQFRRRSLARFPTSLNFFCLLFIDFAPLCPVVVAIFPTQCSRLGNFFRFYYKLFFFLSSPLIEQCEKRKHNKNKLRVSSVPLSLWSC